MADPGFLGGREAPALERCSNLLFCKMFAQNCTKMTECGPRRGRASMAPPWIAAENTPMANKIAQSSPILQNRPKTRY